MSACGWCSVFIYDFSVIFKLYAVAKWVMGLCFCFTRLQSLLYTARTLASTALFVGDIFRFFLFLHFWNSLEDILKKKKNTLNRRVNNILKFELLLRIEKVKGHFFVDKIIFAFEVQIFSPHFQSKFFNQVSSMYYISKPILLSIRYALNLQTNPIMPKIAKSVDKKHYIH